MCQTKASVIQAICDEGDIPVRVITAEEVNRVCTVADFKGLPNNICGNSPGLIITDDHEKNMHIRPLVLKYEKAFIHYVKIYGADAVRKVLSNGRHAGLKLTFMHNKKDRAQMIKLLGL